MISVWIVRVGAGKHQGQLHGRAVQNVSKSRKSKLCKQIGDNGVKRVISLIYRNDRLVLPTAQVILRFKLDRLCVLHMHT
jgi:hypothetical protein